ncbi:hypothetical protein [Mycobacterium sp. 852002-51057_SCH5723018]|uniref:hypothetical protein n=1 Tax=Mycobacterium sp. 852002-51057_SCH5723018 TaxID=1834094 RepID=UPI0007FEA9CD|nr:hypothetical protein [Mycobacterium sp. 852002-51057_SCH5723018]OBG18645.1 hypothetical protein A5764_17700 [Mycobacterium sp. 852002-51057_SCH5723018]
MRRHRPRAFYEQGCRRGVDARADVIDAILAASATVTVLATSREGLGIADERLWPVPALDIGAGMDSAAATRLG